VRVALAVSVLGALIWVSMQEAHSRTQPPEQDEAVPVALSAATVHASAARVAQPRAQPRAEAVSREPDAQESAPATGALDEHPHPLDEARRRLADEQRLIGALNDAMDLGDPRSMRPMIASYRVLTPRDENKLAEGYERIADCLEDPSAAHLEAAREYYDRERASTVRRYVRRHCLER